MCHIKTLHVILMIGVIKNIYFDFGLSSRFVAHLRSLCVHVYVSFVLDLASEHLRPGF